MEIKLDFGPWETIFAGTAYGHEVEVVTNPEHFYLVFIYDKRDGKKAGAVIEGYKAYIARGSMESFLQTMPKTCFGIEKNFGDKTSKIFFLSFEPFYVDFKQDDYTRKIDNIIQKTDEGASTIIDLARASSVDLKELSVSAKSDYAPVLGDPMAIMGMVLGRKENQLSKMDVSQKDDFIEEVAPMLQLGLSKTREIIKEPSKNIYRTQIIGEGLAQYYALYVLAENMLLENIPVILIDDESYFEQLGGVSRHGTDLKEELVDFEPMAFPVKSFKAKETITVSIKDADLVFIFELMGLVDNEFSKKISLFGFTAQANTPLELIQKILESSEINPYEKLRAERMLQIVNLSLQKVFGKAVPAEEITKTIPGRLGRAVIINTKKMTIDEKTVFIHILVRQLTKSASEANKTRAVVMIPNFSQLLIQNPQRVTNSITRLENRGVGIILGCNQELPEEIAQTITTKMSIVSQKDVAVSVKGKRNYRITLRPTLSGDPKV